MDTHSALSGQWVAFFDWDGTLSPDGACLAPGNAEAIERWRAAGHLAVLATGRATVWLPERGAELCGDGLLAGAGAFVKIGDKQLIRRALDPADLTRYITWFLREGKTILVFEGEREAFVLNDTDRYGHCTPIREPLDFAARYPDRVITKMTIPEREISPEMTALFADYDLIYNPTWIEVVPRGCSKAAGMYAMLDEWGIPHDHSIAFGDSGNDLAILTAAGIAVAMPHSPSECLEVATIVAPPTKEGGVGQVLDRLLEYGI